MRLVGRFAESMNGFLNPNLLLQLRISSILKTGSLMKLIPNPSQSAPNPTATISELHPQVTQVSASLRFPDELPTQSDVGPHGSPIPASEINVVKSSRAFSFMSWRDLSAWGFFDKKDHLRSRGDSSTNAAW